MKVGEAHPQWTEQLICVSIANCRANGDSHVRCRSHPVYSDGEAYEERNGKWSRIFGSDYIDWLGVKNNARWLDVGCGTGPLCEVILNRCAPLEYVGIDVAPAVLEYARTRHTDERAKFQMDDPLKLSFGENEFDAAVSAPVINFLPDPVQMVSEMKRV